MVIPLGAPGDGLEREPVPTHVREHHAKWWWCLFVVLLMSMIIQLAGQAIFSALYTGISAYIVWYMLRDSCKEMSAICLMMLGLMSAMQGVFDLIILCSMLGGRREQHTERTHYDEKTGSTEYKVRFEWHPFFDESQGTLYNMQSLARLVSPIVMFTTAALCYWSHSYFETEMLENESVMGPDALGGFGDGFGGGGGPYGAAGYGGGGQRVGGSGGGQRLGGGGGNPAGPAATRGSAHFAPFGGQGQRLGA